MNEFVVVIFLRVAFSARANAAQHERTLAGAKLNVPALS